MSGKSCSRGACSATYWSFAKVASSLKKILTLSFHNEVTFYRKKNVLFVLTFLKLFFAALLVKMLLSTLRDYIDCYYKASIKLSINRAWKVHKMCRFEQPHWLCAADWGSQSRIQVSALNGLNLFLFIISGTLFEVEDKAFTVWKTHLTSSKMSG